MVNFDINVDMGEGHLIEKDLMPIIQSCNIACGGHAGSDNEIKECIYLAKKHQVKIGAHPSYPDKKNFGRITMQIDKKKLALSLESQLNSFIRLLKNPKELHHVKPHGALYKDCAINKTLAKIFLNAVFKCCPWATIFTHPNSELEKQAKKIGVKVWGEVFLDRTYIESGQLEVREKPGAIIADVNTMYSRLIALINNNQLQTVKGVWISMKAETFCLHGDHPNAFQNLQDLLKLYHNQKTL